jgi:hypothetical protein
MFDLRRLSFGGPAAIVTSMALIVGLGTATAGKAAIIGSLLVIGLADNLTDSLSVHIYQEAERMAHRQALRTTVANYIARMTVTASFVLLVLLLPMQTAAFAAMAWGVFLLSGLTYLLAKARQVSVTGEIVKHAGVALGVIVISKAIGLAIQGATGMA